MDHQTRPQSAAVLAAQLSSLFSKQSSEVITILRAVGPSRSLCEVDHAFPVERNALFIGLSEVPVSLSLIDQGIVEELFLEKSQVLPVAAGSWISLAGEESTEVLQVEVRDSSVFLSLHRGGSREEVSLAMVLSRTNGFSETFDKMSDAFCQTIRENDGKFPEESSEALRAACKDLFDILSNAKEIEAENHSRGGGYAHTAAHFLRSNLHLNIRRPSIALYCGISESYLTLLIRKHFGLSLTDLLNLLRVHRAFEYIVGSELRVSDIAAICGFSSNNYFIRAYRTINGLTPLQVRKLYHGKAQKSLEDHYRLHKLKGFRLIESIAGHSMTMQPANSTENLAPFAVANTRPVPVVLYRITSEGVVLTHTETWIPPGRSRLLWSAPGSLWQAEEPLRKRSLGLFRTAESPLQTLVFS